MSGGASSTVTSAVVVTSSVGVSSKQPALLSSASARMGLEVMPHGSQERHCSCIRERNARAHRNHRVRKRRADCDGMKMRMPPEKIDRIVCLGCEHRRARTETNTNVRTCNRIQSVLIAPEQPIDPRVELYEIARPGGSQTCSRTHTKRRWNCQRSIGGALLCADITCNRAGGVSVAYRHDQAA